MSVDCHREFRISVSHSASARNPTRHQGCGLTHAQTHNVLHLQKHKGWSKSTMNGDLAQHVKYWAFKCVCVCVRVIKEQTHHSKPLYRWNWYSSNISIGKRNTITHPVAPKPESTTYAVIYRMLKYFTKSYFSNKVPSLFTNVSQ